MKILSLYFKNINSIEGESRIQFDRPPIADGGVFAITGPNGSGKSSILDAITLGLYGETFRFDRPAEHVMTKSTAESFVEVEFSLGEEKYRSSWHVSRKDGQAEEPMLPPEMKLMQLNGSEQVLEQSIQKVRDKMAELTGMDFHKFGKSMVLAQGEFSAFLNALDSERMDILEKISGTDIYQDYKQRAEETHKQSQIRLQELEQDLNAIPLLDESAREASVADLADFKDQKLELSSQKESIEQQLVDIQNVSAIDIQIEKLLKQQQQAETQQLENQQLMHSISAVKDTAVLEVELANVDQQTETTVQSKKTLDSYRNELGRLQSQLKSSGLDEASLAQTNSNSPKSVAEQKASLEELKLKVSDIEFVLPKETALLETLEQQNVEKKSLLENTEAWLQEHAEDVGLQEGFPQIVELQTLRKEISGKEEDKKTNQKLSKKINAKLSKKQENQNALIKKKEQLAKQIADDEKSLQEIVDGGTLLDIQEMENEQQERLQNFQELYDLATVNAKLGKKSLFGQIISFKQGNKEEQQLKKEHESLQLEIGREKNIITTLENAVTNEALLKKMTPDREHLVDGRPCQLCGALEHPYSKHAPAVSNSAQVLLEQRKKVKALIASLESVAKQISSVQKQANKDEQKDGQLQVVCSQWNSLANKLNVANVDMDIANLSLMKDLVKQEKKEVSNIKNLLKQYSKQQQTISQGQTNLEKTLVTSARLTEEIVLLNTEKESQIPDESPEVAQKHTDTVAKEQVLSEQILKQLEALGEVMPTKGKEDALIKRIETRKQDYKTYVLLQQTLTEEVAQLTQQIETSSVKTQELNQQAEALALEQTQQESAGLHLSLIEKQKMIAEKEAEFFQQEAALKDLKTALSEKSQAISAGDLDKLKDVIVLAKRKPELEQTQLDVSQKITAYSEKLDKLTAKLEVEKNNVTSEYSEPELLAQQKNFNQKLDIAKQEINTLQNKLDKQDDLRQKHQAFSIKVNEQKILTDNSAAEIKLINDESGVSFRKKVQQGMADKLMSQSNQILEKISGRYYVRSVESEHGLALEIEDTKQKNARRLPKTLSGGESFIVSLALALGLAEMTNNGHALDSLFLDEGFGNLDSESLYLAMTTLESLKTHGKVVGVISHVEGVKKRIKTQIEMIKKPNGMSALKMVS